MNFNYVINLVVLSILIQRNTCVVGVWKTNGMKNVRVKNIIKECVNRVNQAKCVKNNNLSIYIVNNTIFGVCK